MYELVKKYFKHECGCCTKLSPDEILHTTCDGHKFAFKKAYQNKKIKTAKCGTCDMILDAMLE